MPIPDFAAEGFLPEGIHLCSIDEITERFGKFQRTDQRPKLNAGLIKYIEELKDAQIGKYLIVNGSYVTGKDTPSDIDVLLVLKDEVDLSGDLPPFKRNTFSKNYITKHHKLDFHLAFEDEPHLMNVLENFKEVKYQPGKVKGILRIDL